MANTKYDKAVVKSSDGRQLMFSLRNVDLYSDPQDLVDMAGEENNYKLGIDAFINKSWDAAKMFEESGSYMITILLKGVLLHGQFRFIDFGLGEDSLVTLLSEDFNFDFHGGYDG